MRNPAVIALCLVLAACLEVGGDALVRAGLKNHAGLPPAIYMLIGGLVLFGYGLFVNAAPIDFGRALGIYVVLFFIVAQAVNLFAFGIYPSTAIIFGGALIAAGGAVITFSR